MPAHNTQYVRGSPAPSAPSRPRTPSVAGAVRFMEPEGLAGGWGPCPVRRTTCGVEGRPHAAMEPARLGPTLAALSRTLPRMPSLLSRYLHWLHLDWPAGRVEPLPVVGPDGRTHVPGLYISGDLTGIPLLKFALDSGVRAMRAIHGEITRAARPNGATTVSADDAVDVAILGAGVSGMAAAMEARRLGLRFELIEASEPFSTLANFPKAKPIFTYPRAMHPQGELQVQATVKEPLVEELRLQAARAGLHATPGRAERVERRDGALHVHLHGGRAVRAGGDRPERRLPEAQGARRAPRQGLQPPPRPGRLPREGRAGGGRRRRRPGGRDRARRCRRAHDALLPRRRVEPREARERRRRRVPRAGGPAGPQARDARARGPARLGGARAVHG